MYFIKNNKQINYIKTQFRKTAYIFVAFLAMNLLFCSCLSSGGKEKIVEIHQEEKNQDYSADIKYPEFKNYPEFNLQISSQVNLWYTDFQDSVAKKKAVLTPDNYPPYVFYSNWENAKSSAKYCSVLLNAYSFTGGANGRDYLASFTLDKATGKSVTLQQILPLISADGTLESVAEKCRKNLTEELDAKDDKFLLEGISQGTLPVPENYKVFTVSSKGVWIYFQKYQVAPGVYGIQKVFFPFI